MVPRARTPVIALLAAALVVACVGPGRSTVPAMVEITPPTDEARRLAEVLANAGCRDCHNADGDAADTRLVFPSANARPESVDRAAAALWELVDVQDPSRSRLLRKPTKRMMHEGGQKIVPGSPEEKAMLSWLVAAARAGRGERAAVRDVLVAGSSGLSWPVRYQGTPAGLRRLTRDELVVTLEDLTGTAPPREELPEDPRAGHGMLVTAGVPFLTGEILALKLVMKEFAAKVAPTVLAASGCETTGPSQAVCLTAWAEGFATRAFRRLPSADERILLRALVADTGTSRAADLAAVEGALAALFQSPSFLYRSELGVPVPDQSGLRALDADELAARLSFLATLAPPDAELVAAARAGRLVDPAERVRQLDRLTATERGRRAQAVFVLEWLGANETRLGFKSLRYVKDLGRDFAPAVRNSAEDAIRQVLGGDAPTVEALLSTTSYLADGPLEALMAADGKHKSGDTDATRRMGLLMHPQVLAAHTKENGASPFQIGVFVREALLCEQVPAPPPDAAASARTDEPKGLSTRERFEHRTNAGRACAGCHRTFSPLGYAFLPFDPVGRWLREDPAGKAWDLSGTVATFSGVPISFSSPAELTRQLAHHPQVHGCFAQAALQWTLGRQLAPQDQALVQTVGEVARRTRGNVPAIFRAIVAAPAFAHAIASRSP